MKFTTNLPACRALALCIAAGTLIATAGAANYPKYRITDLGVPTGAWVLTGGGGRPIDASGDVVYMLGTAAWIWKSDGTPPINITTYSGNSIITTANGINALGQVTGSSKFGTNPHAFIWKNDGTAMLDLGTLGTPNDARRRRHQ